ncbi:hypothetical protein V3C99_001023 [Haemonchus contortus]
MPLVFGLLLLFFTVLGENTVLQVIEEISGFNELDLYVLRGIVTAKRNEMESVATLDEFGLKGKFDDFQKRYMVLPEDAKRFIDKLFEYGAWALSWSPSKANWDRLKSEFQNKISKSSCSTLLEEFPELKKRDICIV